MGDERQTLQDRDVPHLFALVNQGVKAGCVVSAPLEELMQAALAVPEERREPAIKFLRGELEPHRPVFDPVLLNMGEAAKYLNISRPTLWRMIQAGRLRPVELFAGSRRIRRSDLDAIVQGNTPDKSEGGAR